MTHNERLIAIANATELQLDKIDRILDGRDTSENDHVDENLHLLTIMEACKRSNISYPKIYRAMKDRLLDTVDCTGRRMITESSLVEFCRGERHPSAEVLERRAARNAARREAYRLSKAKS